MMSHLLSLQAPTTAISRKTTPSPFSHIHKVWGCSQSFDDVSKDKQVIRRGVLLGLAGAIFVMNGGDREARAAARRPPPPPPQEKKDPSISGLTAKILASKKRKEAMKESIVKLKENGKPIKE
ncbi:unnamed protein product [Fraxinus pennsylvanica]|uniref:Uncharacterized protein n=1 Tax=Fraxinus pennsylvanica TaxID=56036 RepID=A0AAD2E684_9LAMI|nr:unnamed protein product [Fraxinus pennsylvanica]